MMTSAQPQQIMQPAVQDADDIAGRLRQLEDRIDVLPSQVGTLAEVRFLQAQTALGQAIASVKACCETLKQIAMAN